MKYIKETIDKFYFDSDEDDNGSFLQLQEDDSFNRWVSSRQTKKFVEWLYAHKMCVLQALDESDFETQSGSIPMFHKLRGKSEVLSEIIEKLRSEM